MTSVNQIRKTFLDYFAKNGHKVVPSLNKNKEPKNIEESAFFNGGITSFDDMSK